MTEIAERVMKNATTYGAKHGHKYAYSRSPYGQHRPNCHHNYPCSVHVDKKKELILDVTVNLMKEKGQNNGRLPGRGSAL